MSDVARRVARVVSGVVAAHVASVRAEAVVLLDDESPEGRLVYEWLVSTFGASRVWRMTVLASNVHGVADAAEAQAIAVHWAASGARIVVAHPANKTALLLGGPLPRADVFPAGDLYGTQVEALTGGWSAPSDVGALIAQAGGIGAVDAVLTRLVDGREDRTAATRDLDSVVAAALLGRYDAGRPFRSRAALVPKLGSRTIGVDLFD